MNTQRYLSEKIKLQSTFSEFINDDDNAEEHYQNLLRLIEDQNITSDINEFRLFLHFINNISSNHYRTKNFFPKIEKVLLIFRDFFSKNLLDEDILNLFDENKRILLFLFESKILNINFYINRIMNSNIYKKYFKKEIKEFESREENHKYKEDDYEYQEEEEDQEDPDFEENRKKGENESLLCYIIRNDLLNEFITYITRNELPLNVIINHSIYETNIFLLDERTTLIEYASFFGSIQIFKYLIKNQIKLKSSLWLYAVHGNNTEIIKILKDNKIFPKDKSYRECLSEAIKCHHNDIVLYIKSNIISNQIDIDEFIESESIKYYNFILFPKDNFFNRSNFYVFCKYDYFFFVEEYISSGKIDVNFKTCDIIDDLSGIFTPLAIAIINNSFSIAELLLKQPGIDVNFQFSYYDLEKSDEKTFTLLSMAILHNNPKIVELLLNTENIDVNSISVKKFSYENNKNYVEEYSPLSLSLSLSMYNLQIFKMLLSHPSIDVNLKLNSITYGFNNRTKANYIESSNVLTKAIQNKNYDAVKLLLEFPKIDVNAILYEDNHEVRVETIPLISAILTKDVNIVKLLLSHPEIDVNKIASVKKINRTEDDQQTPLNSAIRTLNSNNEILSLLLSHKNIDVNMKTVYYYEDKEIIETPLNNALRNNKNKTIELLLSHPNIDVNATYFIKEPNDYCWENYSLFLALQNSKEDIALLLLNHPKIDVNIRNMWKKFDCSKSKQRALLHFAIRKGNINIIKAILDNPKIDINIKSFDKSLKNEVLVEEELTTMHFAILSDKIEIIKLLLAKPELDVNMKMIKTVLEDDSFFIEEQTPLQAAINMKNAEIIHFLLSYLRKNCKLTDDLNELIRATNDIYIKAIIYDNIYKKS